MRKTHRLALLPALHVTAWKHQKDSAYKDTITMAKMKNIGVGVAQILAITGFRSSKCKICFNEDGLPLYLAPGKEMTLKAEGSLTYIPDLESCSIFVEIVYADLEHN